jgi:lantibiotic biosynthesis protein
MTSASTELTGVRETALRTADRIGARLVRDAVRDGRRATWLGEQMEPVNGQWGVVLKACGHDVYSGTAGIAMFLARLHQQTGEPLFESTAEAALEHGLSGIASMPAEVKASLWSGVAGLAWTCLDAGTALERGSWIDRGLALVETVESLNPVADAVDVTTGSAGVIPFLLHVHRRYGRQSSLVAAARHGEALLASARQSDAGCSWQTMPAMPGYENRDLTGLSHGTSGIALALFELAKVTGDPRFATAATQAFAYEQRYFSGQHNNWPDFREMQANTPESQWGYSVTWCHGAPGIALARLRAWQITGRPEYRAQAEIALRTTAASLESSPMGMGSWCLCHGTAGNADVLLVGSEVLGDPAWQATAVRAASRGINTYEDGELPWPPGVNGGSENPSLMLGNAGVGWFFLRLADPLRVPSVLAMLNAE